MQNIQRIKLSNNKYENLYDMNILYDGLKNNMDQENYDFQKIINLYSKYKNTISSGVWKWINDNQKELFDALEENNIVVLNRLFSNFFRNKMLSNGLVSHNLLDNNDITTEQIRLNTFFNILLQDIDTCRELTNIDDISLLDFPRIGNPYGILLNNTLIPPDQPRHYYDAKKIYEITKDIEHPIIFEIGGGYGGLLINLLKIFNNKKFTYVNCDIYSTSMIFIYIIENYLKNINIIINNNNIINNDLINPEKTNIILNIFNNDILHFEKNIDLTYNSHSLSEMSEEHVKLYMDIIMKNKSKYFYHINADYFPWKTSHKGHIEINASKFPINKNYKKLTHSISPWISGGNERYREFLYEKYNE